MSSFSRFLRFISRPEGWAIVKQHLVKDLAAENGAFIEAYLDLYSKVLNVCDGRDEYRAPEGRFTFVCDLIQNKTLKIPSDGFYSSERNHSYSHTVPRRHSFSNRKAPPIFRGRKRSVVEPMVTISRSRFFQRNSTCSLEASPPSTLATIHDDIPMITPLFALMPGFIPTLLPSPTLAFTHTPTPTQPTLEAMPRPKDASTPIHLLPTYTRVYHNFMTPGSPMFLNLPFQLVDMVTEKATSGRWTLGMFDDVAQEVLCLIWSGYTMHH